jgi:hypothetical protein
VSKKHGHKFKKAIKAPPGSKPEKPTLAKGGDGPRPVFSHRYITNGAYCLKRCSIEQFRHLADKLRMLSNLEWKQIDSSPRETNGYEMLPVAQLAERPPSPFDKAEAVMIFRFGGAKGGRMAGVKKDEKFYILFVDHDFTLYDHS